MKSSTAAASPLISVWHHLDQLCPDDGDLLTVAADSIEAVATALRDDKPVHKDVMARLLDSAARTVRDAHRHTGNAIIALGDYCQACRAPGPSKAQTHLLGVSLPEAGPTTGVLETRDQATCGAHEVTVSKTMTMPR